MTAEVTVSRTIILKVVMMVAIPDSELEGCCEKEMNAALKEKAEAQASLIPADSDRWLHASEFHEAYNINFREPYLDNVMLDNILDGTDKEDT